MARLTPLSLEDARRVATAHGLPAPERVEAVAGGTVNSNHMIAAGARRWFVRVYEEQDDDGVAFEEAVARHLHGAGVAVARVRPPRGPRVRVAGRPVAVFDDVGGVELCQASVTRGRAAAVGRALARAHRAGWGPVPPRRTRFGPDALRRRLGVVRSSGRRDLAAAVDRAEASLDALGDAWARGLPRGLVHGDLFRDNVRWRGDAPIALLDWESAGDGPLVYDLAVAVLAWCWGDRLDPSLAAALCAGYAGERPPGAAEARALRDALRAGATRFLVTRLTDVELRRGAVPSGKDYRRFLLRLDEVEARDEEAWAALLGPAPGTPTPR